MFNVAHFVFQDYNKDEETLMSDLLSPFDLYIWLCMEVNPTVWQGTNLMGVIARCLGSFIFLSFFLSSFSLSSLSCLSFSYHRHTTLSSPWGQLGIVRHIRKPTVHSPFDTKFIYLITPMNLVQQLLLVNTVRKSIVITGILYLSFQLD